MAYLAGMTETYDLANAIREDLTDAIYMISPTETPFFSAIGRTQARNIVHLWQTDALATQAANQQSEADDVSFTEATATQRLQNATQISHKSVGISGTMMAVNTAGYADAMAYQEAKKAQELKRDVEFNLTQNSVWTDGAINGTVRKSGGYETWIITTNNANFGAGGGVTANSGGQPNESATHAVGTARALTEPMLKDVLQSCYTNGGNPNLLIAGPKNKQNISAFSGNTTRMDRSEDMRLVTAIDVYVSDFGELKVVPDRFSAAGTVMVVDTRYWAVAFLRGFRSKILASNGDYEKRMVLCEFTLESRNQASSGAVWDLTS